MRAWERGCSLAHVGMLTRSGAAWLARVSGGERIQILPARWCGTRPRHERTHARTLRNDRMCPTHGHRIWQCSTHALASLRSSRSSLCQLIPAPAEAASCEHACMHACTHALLHSLHASPAA